MARRIEQEDLAESIAEALQFISHHHPPDFVRALRRAHAAETHAPAKAAIEQMLINSRLAARGRRPICQDTGVVQVFLRVGAGCNGPTRRAAPRGLQPSSTRRYGAPTPTRQSLARFDGRATRSAARQHYDNTPAIVHTEIVDGDGSRCWSQPRAVAATSRRASRR